MPNWYVQRYAQPLFLTFKREILKPSVFPSKLVLKQISKYLNRHKKGRNKPLQPIPAPFR